MDFSTSGLVIDTITIITQCVTMESGKVDWKLEGDDDVVENLSFSSQRGMCYLLSNSENHEHLRYMYGWNVYFVLYVTAVSYYILELCQMQNSVNLHLVEMLIIKFVEINNYLTHC